MISIKSVVFDDNIIWTNDGMVKLIEAEWRCMICVRKLSIIGSDNGLSPGRRQVIIWPNDGILSIGPLGTNFSKISIKILTFQFKKLHLKITTIVSWPQCVYIYIYMYIILYIYMMRYNKWLRPSNDYDGMFGYLFILELIEFRGKHSGDLDLYTRHLCMFYQSGFDMYWVMEKMADFLQTTISYWFSWYKFSIFYWNFIEICSW